MTTLTDINRAWVALFTRATKKARVKKAWARVQDVIRNDGAYAINMLPFPLAFPRAQYDAVSVAGRRIIAAQTRILAHLLQTRSRRELLQLFALPPLLERYIDWDELLANRAAIARFDVLPTPDGLRMCELNYGSPVGGMEEFDCYRTYAEALGLPIFPAHASPRRHTARLIAGLARQHRAARVLLLVLGQHRHLGYFSLEFLRRHLQGELPDVPVEIVDEHSYPEPLLVAGAGQGTLVYRLFVMDDILSQPEFFGRLFDSGATMINGFESEVRMSKRWFCLMHEPQYRALLPADECAAIDEYIPVSFELVPSQLDQVLARKDAYVFKTTNSFGGKGVLIGCDHDVSTLRTLLTADAADAWSVQALVEFEGMPLPGPDRELVPHHLVFGLFFIGDVALGMNVRASASSRVVNVSVGKACSGWAIPLEDDAATQLMHDLVRALSPPPETPEPAPD